MSNADAHLHQPHGRARTSDPEHPTRRSALGWLTAAAATGAIQSSAFAQQASPPLLRSTAPLVVAPAPIEVTARPFAAFHRTETARRQFGRLEFRGGLVLTSSSSEFGGWSGLILSDDGRQMLAISDRGSWLTANLVYDGSRPMGFSNAVLGPVTGLGGRALRGRDRDAELVTLLDGTLSRGTVLIAFERHHRIGRFPISERGLGPPLGYLKMPAEARRMLSNRGLEALAVLRGGPLKGAVVAFAEEFLDENRNHTGWVWPAGIASDPQRLNLTNIADFAVTDMVSLPDGSLVVLERKFRWLEGVRMRLRLVRAADVRPGAVLEGEVLLEADMGYEIDNMEGLAVSRDGRGQTVLTIVSDDNFNSMLQRSLLLQFTLAPEQISKAKASEPDRTTR